MKIDEASINHNIARLIADLESWDISNPESATENGLRIMTLGYIKGVTDLGKALKEVLKA